MAVRIGRLCVVLFVFVGLLGPVPAARAASESKRVQNDPGVSGEIVNRRTASTRTVSNDDGSLTTSLFAGPVHYQDSGGTWRTIDTRLGRSTRQGYRWSAAHNSFAAHFVDDTDQGLVGWDVAGQTFAMTLQGAATARATASGSTVRYDGVLDGVDAVYEVGPAAVKETLVLASAEAGDTFVFHLDTPAGTTATRARDGSWVFSSPPAPAPLFTLAPPYAVDASRPRDVVPAQPHAALDVRRDATGFVVELAVDQAWLRSEDRKFPVYVDPTVNFTPALSSDDAAYGVSNTEFGVCSFFCYRGAGPRLPVGSSNSERWRSALRFDVSSLPLNADIHYATMKVWFPSECVSPVGLTSATQEPGYVANCGLSAHTINAHRATRTWGPSTDPTYDAPVLASDSVPAAGLGQTVPPSKWLLFSLSNLTKQWYSGQTTNRGVVLKRATDDYGSSGPAFVSSDSTDSEHWPTLIVNYDETVQLLPPAVVHSDGAELSWTKYAGASGVAFSSYDITRGYTVIASITDVDTLTYQDTTAGPNQYLDYGVRVNGVGYSNIVTVQTPAVGQAKLTLQAGGDGARATQIRDYSGLPGANCANFGAQDRVNVGPGDGFTARGLIDFDVSAIPANATIANATLSLYHDAVPAGADGQVAVHPALAGWAEGDAVGVCSGTGVTWEQRDTDQPWDSAGGDYDPTAGPSAVSPAGQGAAWDEFDISSIVTKWAQGAYSRNGLVLTTPTSSALMSYHSDDSADPLLRPKLSVTFTDGRTPNPPTLELVSPSDGDTITDAQPKMTVVAEDDSASNVTVKFYANNTALPWDVWPPYEADLSGLANGEWTLKAIARDAMGNDSEWSDTATVTIDRSAPPTISWTSPVANPLGGPTPLTNPQLIKVAAADDVAVQRVEYYLDGERFRTQNGAPSEFLWDQLDPAFVGYNGVHTLTARAFDAQGQSAKTTDLSVRIDNNAATIYRASFNTTALNLDFKADTTTATETNGEGLTPGGQPETQPASLTVTNNSAQTWPASRVKAVYRWMDQFGDPATYTNAAGNTVVVPEGMASFANDVAAGATAGVNLEVTPPPMSDGVDRAVYTLRLDLFDDTENVYFAAMGNAPKDSKAVVVDQALAKKLGLERYYHYLTGELGAGMGHLVNVANGNSIVRLTPFVSPGRGLSTVADLTYNSRESHSRSPAGNAFSLSLSGLVPIGEKLKIHPPGQGTQYLEFSDGDGTTHRFDAVLDPNDATKVLYYQQPAGVHLYARKYSTAATTTKKWAFTRPDRVTYFFDQDGYPTSVEDGNTAADGSAQPNAITYTYTAVAASDDPGNNAKHITAVTDAAGRPFTIGYYSKDDPVQARVRGRIKTLADHSGSTLRFEYYDDGNLRRLIQKGGGPAEVKVNDRIWVFTYTHSSLNGAAITDADLRRDPSPDTAPQSTALFSVRDPKGRETTFTYVTSGQNKRKLASRTARDGGLTAYSYNIPAKTTTMVEPVTPTTTRTSTYTYDPAGRPTRLVNPKGEATSLQWWDTNNVKTIIKEPSGTFTGTSRSFTYDANGYLTSATDELDLTTTSEEAKHKTELTYTYTAVDAKDDPTVTGRSQHISVLATKTSPEGVATPETTQPVDGQWNFTHTGSHLTQVKAPPDETGTRHHSDYTYFDNGNLLTVTDFNQGPPTTFGDYNNNGQPERVTDPLGNITLMRFDVDGLLTSVQDPMHHSYAQTAKARTEYVYDAFHRLRRESTPKSTSRGLGLLWAGTDYDANDNVIKQVQPHAGDTYSPAKGDTTTFTYDVMDRAKKITGPDTTTDDGTVQAEETVMTYDRAGRLLTQTEPMGVLTPTVPNDYMTTLVYDDLDRVIRQERGLDTAEPHYTHYCYDAAGDLVRVTAPNAALTAVNCNGVRPSHTTAYTYDAEHQVRSVDDPAVSRDAQQFDYDRNGNLIKTSFPQSPDDLVNLRPRDYETRTYDGRDRLLTVGRTFDWPQGPAPTPRMVTSKNVYDGAGNVVTSVTPRAWDAASNHTNFDEADYVTHYKFDAAQQLTRVSLPTAPATPARYVHHGYDRNGRLAWSTLPTPKANPAMEANGWPKNSDVPVALRTHIDYFDPGWIRTTDDGANPGLRFDYTPEGWQASRVPLTPASPDVSLQGSEVTDDKVTWTYEDDGQLREQAVTRPNIAGQRTAHAGTIIYKYDANNRLIRADDAIGVTTASQRTIESESEYDTLNRLIKTRERQGAGTDGVQKPWQYNLFGYDRNDNTVRRDDDGLEGTTTKARISEMVYDEADWLTHTFQRGTNLADLSDDRRVRTAFHPRGWEAQRDVEKYTAGQWTRMQTTTWDHFGTGDLRKMEVTGRDGGRKQLHTVSYLDDDGNYVNGHRTEDRFTRVNESGAACQTSECVLTYVYDAQDRLTRETRSGGGSNYDGYTNYTLTDSGGIDIETSVQDGDTTTRDFDYTGDRLKKISTSIVNATGESTTARRYVYDADGNLDCIVAETTTPSCSTGLFTDYRYDALNRMVRYTNRTIAGGTPADTATYTFDAFDRAFSQTEAHDGATRSTAFNYLGMTGTVTSETHHTGTSTATNPTATKSYSFDAFGNRVTMTNTEGTEPPETFTYSHDVHGSVSLLLKNGENFRAAYGYRPYGEEDTDLTNGDDNSDAPLNPYRYTGKRLDSGSQTLDMGARRFGPDTTKFLQQDQYLGALSNLGLATDRLTQNRYSLAGGNPIGYMEWDGHRVVADGRGDSVYVWDPPVSSTTGDDKSETSEDSLEEAVIQNEFREVYKHGIGPCATPTLDMAHTCGTLDRAAGGIDWPEPSKCFAGAHLEGGCKGPRWPDAVSIQAPIPRTNFVKKDSVSFAGLNAQFTLDRHGKIYAGIGEREGISWLSGVSVTGLWKNQSVAASENEISSDMQGWSREAGGAHRVKAASATAKLSRFLYFGQLETAGGSNYTELGFSTPTLGAGSIYSWKTGFEHGGW